MNRVYSTIKKWNYVPGSENPAEMCRRYTPLQRVHLGSAWINLPSLLYQNNTKVSFDKIYNLPHEFDDIESQINISKRQEYQSLSNRTITRPLIN